MSVQDHGKSSIKLEICMNRFSPVNFNNIFQIIFSGTRAVRHYITIIEQRIKKCQHILWDIPGVMSEAICSWSWWHHQLETFSALPALCAGNSPVIGEFPSHRPVRRSFDVIFDLRLKSGWFETPSRSLWRNCNTLRVLLENTAKQAHSSIMISHSHEHSS